ncbi:expressed unknown protein [Seminavis robusta]|uniref:Uncharacterized protein n=1 Tax=Seminavis robusta TaxID=568900 RepID=A0A9N8DSJ8_9STRA|nr:expressed unknown protein [Seminavis robusta]|eukprot:Sro325_g117710.1 n/a (274) ;mRNA; r:11421-12327
MGKTRIGDRLSKNTTGEAPDEKKNRSAELEEFNAKFDEFTKQFKPLVTVLKNHHAQLQKLQKTQGDVTTELAKWIEKSPIENAENNPANVQVALGKLDNIYSDKYQREVIEYVREWELVIKTRVEASCKQAKEMKQDLSHYEKKTESLSKGHEAAVAKEKTPSPKDVERLKRNEEKLSLARDSYEAHATRLVELIEQVVDNAWKDLLPLLLRMIRMDTDKITDHNEIIESSNVMQNLKNLAEEYKIDLTTPPPGAAEKTVVAADPKKVVPLKQ